MEFQPPSDLRPFEVLFDRSELNQALPPELVRFVGNLGFPSPPADRPWVYTNLVQSLDGLVSFGGKRPGGVWVARSRHDRWMMDLLRAHADAILYGAGSLLLETLYGPLPGGPVFRVVQPELLRLREERLGRRKLIVIVATGSGNLRPADYRLFHSEHVEAWIATTPEGRERLGHPGQTRVLTTGRIRQAHHKQGDTVDSASSPQVDLGELLRRLRSELGIAYLLCEGGPTLYGHLVRGGWVDEKFVTIAPQEIGPGIPPAQDLTDWEKSAGMTTRPTTFAGTGFTLEEAPWYRWLSCRKAGEHEFNRYRRTFSPLTDA